MQSPSSPFIRFVQEKKTARQVAAILGCNLGSAKEGLMEARELLSERGKRCEAAAGIMLHSGIARPEVPHLGGYHCVSRWHGWQDIALGLKRST